MRLTNEYKVTIKKIVSKYFGNDSRIFLFGSRVNNNLRGGDIDLYIETKKNEKILELKIKMLGELHKILGEQKIDILINNFKVEKPIFDIAKEEGILL